MQSHSPKRLIDLESAAKLLGVSRWTVRRLIDNGALPMVRLPWDATRTRRRVLVDISDVTALIDRSKDKEGE